MAASRKAGFGLAESGNLDGYVGQTKENFISYQATVRNSYKSLRDERWVTLDVTDMTIHDVGNWVAATITPSRKIVR